MNQKRVAIFGFFVLAAAAGGGVIGRENLQINLLKPLRERTVVEMTAEGFSPTAVTLYEDNDVCFVNNDTVDHWPASNNHPTHAVYPEFDPKEAVKPGSEWCFTFDLPGTWRFHDHLKPEFMGTVTVRDK